MKIPNDLPNNFYSDNDDEILDIINNSDIEYKSKILKMIDYNKEKDVFITFNITNIVVGLLIKFGMKNDSGLILATSTPFGLIKMLNYLNIDNELRECLLKDLEVRSEKI